MTNKSDNGYYGIDRDLFEPLLVEAEFEKNIPNKKYTLISSFYPDGWRKKAYELYEANQISVTESDFYILGDYETAVKIQELINPYIGDYEIFRIQVADNINAFAQNTASFGYDFAYPEGDHYSAIKNGLFVNRSEALYKKYSSYLNRHGLFNDTSLFENYIKDFKQEAPSEQDSTFWIYHLTKE